MYTGPQLTMVADNTPPGSNTAEVVAADLAKIGIKLKTISVTHSTMYTRFCNVPKNEPNVCPNVGWLPDFHEPQAILDVTFNGKNITAVNNSNWPLLNVPSINKEMDKAEQMLDPETRYAAWGKIDQQVVRTASAIPWIWENYPTLFSSGSPPPPDSGTGAPGRDLHGGQVAGVAERAEPKSAPRLEPGRPGPARALPHSLSAFSARRCSRYIVRRLAWAVVMLFVVSAPDVPDLLHLPLGRSGGAAGRKTGDAAADRADPSRARPRQARLRAVLHLHEGPRAALRPRLLVPEQRSGRPEIFARLPVDDLAHRRRLRRLDADRDPRRDLLRDQAALGASTARDGRRSRRDLGAGLLARPSSLFLFSRHRQGPPLPRRRSYVPLTQDPEAWFPSLLLPWFVLAAAFAAFYARMVRGNLIEVMGEDYIRTARAKGLPERRVILRHGLRAALTPIVTMAGLDLGILLGGAVLTETVFNIPGIGRFAYDSIVNSDLPAIQGTVLFGAFFIIVANLIVDILYAFLDPRVRY